ncbi:MAG: hypothetical protein AAFQ41_16455 [Cyanobacteria bacterium J06623_7]
MLTAVVISRYKYSPIFDSIELTVFSDRIKVQRKKPGHPEKAFLDSATP